MLRSGKLTIDLGLGRTIIPLGPRTWQIGAPRSEVYELVAGPYLNRATRALGEKLDVWERGSDLVLAAHFTQVARTRVTTVETVRFEPPERISFRLLRGPVPHVVESFELHESDDGTSFSWSGELGVDLWLVGRWWGRRVASVWERAVESSVGSIKAEAERRAAGRRA